jgi:hypothetical protein
MSGASASKLSGRRRARPRARSASEKISTLQWVICGSRGIGRRGRLSPSLYPRQPETTKPRCWSGVLQYRHGDSNAGHGLAIVPANRPFFWSASDIAVVLTIRPSPAESGLLGRRLGRNWGAPGARARASSRAGETVVARPLGASIPSERDARFCREGERLEGAFVSPASFTSPALRAPGCCTSPVWPSRGGRQMAGTAAVVADRPASADGVRVAGSRKLARIQVDCGASVGRGSA